MFDKQLSLYSRARRSCLDKARENNSPVTMRYKRVNALALDVSSVPANHRIQVVQPLLTFLKLDPTKLTSVQFHSSRKTIFIGLPDDRSAAAIAAKTPRFTITIEGTKIYVPLEFVDEDVIEVRVCDLPPETPANDIKQALRQYGEVLSVTCEVWRDFFPGVPTGVKIARMKVAQNIPARISIGGSSTAVICYDGQPRRNNSSPKSDGKEEKNTAQSQATQQQQQPPRSEANAVMLKQKQQQQQEQQKRPKINPPMDTSDPSSTDFTVVRRKGKATQQVQQQQSTPQNQPPPGPSAFNWQEALANLLEKGHALYNEEEEKRKNREQQNGK